MTGQTLNQLGFESIRGYMESFCSVGSTGVASVKRHQELFLCQKEPVSESPQMDLALLKLSQSACFVAWHLCDKVFDKE